MKHLPKPRLPAFPPQELPTADDHVEALLDEALEETFPASDSVAVSPPARRAIEIPRKSSK